MSLLFCAPVEVAQSSDPPNTLMVRLDREMTRLQIQIKNGRIRYQNGVLGVDQEGLDSEFRVNGIDVVRSSNTISDVIGGVTFSLISDDDPAEVVTVSVISTTEGAFDAVQGFIDAYNSTKGFMREVASFDPETQTAGVLLGDTSILSVDRELSGVLFQSISTLPSQTLDSLNGGTLS